jgi:hypothetical protein
MRIQTALGVAATSIVAATAAQMIQTGTASAAPSGRLVVLDVRTGRIITPGYEFFLSQPPLPMAANAAAPTVDNGGQSVYSGDGHEFRLNS